MTVVPMRVDSGRRRLLLAAGCSAGLAASGCASSPPTRFYDLRLDPPEPSELLTPPALSGLLAPGAATDNGVWELSPSIALPAALDRDTLVVASGDAGLEPLAGHRWAAPLRDSIPRLLLYDLQALRGAGRVWSTPLPTGVRATQRLRVELLALQASADRRTLRLQAQWWWQAVVAGTASTDTLNGAQPRVGNLTLDVPVKDGSVDALAAAHRVALWRLAQQVVRTAPAGR